MSLLVLAAALSLVPGAINSDVTQENIHQTICVLGWTQTIRPPRNVTFRLKLKQLKQFNLPGRTAMYE